MARSDFSEFKQFIEKYTSPVPIGAGAFGCALKANQEKVLKIELAHPEIPDFLAWGALPTFDQEDFDIMSTLMDLQDVNPFVIKTSELLCSTYEPRISNYLEPMLKQNKICTKLIGNINGIKEEYNRREEIIKKSTIELKNKLKQLAISAEKSGFITNSDKDRILHLSQKNVEEAKNELLRLMLTNIHIMNTKRQKFKSNPDEIINEIKSFPDSVFNILNSDQVPFVIITEMVNFNY
jgi:hypothetical protein